MSRGRVAAGLRRRLPGLALCAIALAPAAAGDAPKHRAPEVRLEPIGTFERHVMLDPGAWSPTGHRLALLEAPAGQPPSRVALLDPAQPGAAPVELYDARQWVRSCGWSPDGTWLLVLFGSPSPDDKRWLVGVPADGTAPETLLVAGDIWPAAWGPDGAIHCRFGGRWRSLAAPARWRPADGFVPRRVRSAAPAAGTGLRMMDGAPGAKGDPLLLGTYFTSTGEVRLLDALPDGSRALVMVAGKMRGAVRVVDATGRALLDLRRSGLRFQPTAISADGGLIAGFGGEGGGESGWSRTWLEAAAADGRWSTRVTGGENGQSPQMSREGSYVAFLAPRGTTVARLVVEPR